MGDRNKQIRVLGDRPDIDLKPYRKVLKSIPDEVLLAEAKTRLEALGPYGTISKIRKCKGCGKQGTARWRRAHRCPSGLAAVKR